MNTDTPAHHAQRWPKQSGALRQLRFHCSELCDAASLYATARLDRAGAVVRHVIAETVFAALGVIAISGLVIMSSWLVLSGIAQELSALLGNRPGLGTLLTGLAGLAGVGLGGWRTVAVRRRNTLRATVAKYQLRRMQQRTPPAPGLRDPTPISSAGRERAFLIEQTTNAKRAITTHLREIKESLATLAGIRYCSRKHPWLLTGSAAMVGVAAAAWLHVLSRRRRRVARKRTTPREARSRRFLRNGAADRKADSFLASIVRIVVAAVVPPFVQGILARRDTPDSATTNGWCARLNTPGESADNNPAGGDPGDRDSSFAGRTCDRSRRSVSPRSGSA